MIYPEFIPIYIALIVIIALLIAILLLIILRRPAAGPAPKAVNVTSFTAGTAGPVAFCKNCASQFDAALRCCPKCGTPR